MRRLLDVHRLAPRRSSGQNFVVDPNTVRRIVHAAHPQADDVVLEIGPGLGSLTRPLARVVRRVVAVEVDAGLVGALEETLAGFDNVEVVHADALRVDLGAVVDAGPARLIANLPYNIATPLVMRALATPAITDLFVMVQREVGERWIAGPGDRLRAAVSVKVDLQAHATIDLRVPRTVFHPVPNVDSVMVRMRRRDDAPEGGERSRLFALVDRAFAQRRKTLRNTLRGVVPTERLAEAADTAGIDLSLRAEQVSTRAFRALARELAG